MRGKSFYILGLLLLCSFVPAKPHSKTLAYDSSIVITRSFDSQNLDRFRQDSEFQYQPPSRTEAAAGWWQQLRNWLEDSFPNTFGSELSWDILELIPYLFLAIAAVILILSLHRATFTTLLYSEGQKSRLEFEETEENIHAIDFDQEIEAAQEQGHYRKAIRLLYLKTLKQLTDFNMIEWRANKTNSDYIAELQQSSLQQDFRYITNIFERAWYGHFTMDGSAFAKVKQSFSSFEQQIPTNK